MACSPFKALRLGAKQRRVSATEAVSIKGSAVSGGPERYYVPPVADDSIYKALDEPSR